LESDGRFRVLVLAGDVRNLIRKQLVETLSQALSEHSELRIPLLDRYAAIPGRFNSPIDVFTIHCSPWREVELFDFPDALRPFNPISGYAYEKIWCDDACPFDRYCDGTAYENWGVDRALGALVVIRPDQYIGWVGKLEDLKGMTQYFDGVLKQKTTTSGTKTVV
jgi:phenol 2-monooxygenase